MNSKHEGNWDFDAFVKSEQAAAADGKEIDWAKKRDDWLSSLGDLYETTESFLAEYIKRGEITVDYRDIDLNEENIGSYKVRQMILKIGRQEITVTPIGTLVIGANGRVDVVGRAGRTRLVLVDSKSSGPRIKVAVNIGEKAAPPLVEPPSEESKLAWKIATSPPSVRYVDLAGCGKKPVQM